jgi:DNA-directed RNA polymerase subunit RPC12/RpoP
MKFILPILGVVLLAVLIAALGPLLASRRKHGTLPMGVERNYGIMGGAICTKCNRPFEIPMIALNLGFSKGVVCPNCGKWIFAKRESIEKLRQAEKAELLLGQPVEKVVGESEAERLRKELEDSKYKD